MTRAVAGRRGPSQAPSALEQLRYHYHCAAPAVLTTEEIAARFLVSEGYARQLVMQLRHEGLVERVTAYRRKA